ncbi:unnamed protein product [Caenorhabditis bovis]|uniref:Uncharacterized protein n=1 Tax=Caenorhabditis bovis TaxID=2654633 RepID=A0A8S1F6A7_9PELO|nr:unnamed protein product [Caenorhabditis bovis]
MGYFQKLWPPYYKYAVFLFVGFEFVYSAFVLATSEAYYKSASLILPIAYRMFDDTVQKQKAGFDWSTSEKEILEIYRLQMLVLWVVSTIGVLLCMLVIIPQFFDFNDKRGNPSHLCLVRKTLAYILFAIVAVYVVVLGVAVVWAWSDGGAASRHFHEHFNSAEKEEMFITQLEEAFDCVSDDDLEVANEHMCYQKVTLSFISTTWLHILLLVYIAGHSIAFLAIPLFNRQIISVKADELLANDNNKLLSSS